VMETVEAAERSEELVEPGLTSQPGQVRILKTLPKAQRSRGLSLYH